MGQPPPLPVPPPLLREDYVPQPRTSRQAQVRAGAGSDDVIWQGQPSMIRSDPVRFVLACMLVPVFGIGLLILGVWWLKCYCTRLKISSTATTVELGILSRSTSTIRHADVRNIIVDQTFFQRLLRTGTVGISSAGQGDVEIMFLGITHPQAVADLISSLRDNDAAVVLPPHDSEGIVLPLVLGIVPVVACAILLVLCGMLVAAYFTGPAPSVRNYRSVAPYVDPNEGVTEPQTQPVSEGPSQGDAIDVPAAMTPKPSDPQQIPTPGPAETTPLSGPVRGQDTPPLAKSEDASPAWPLAGGRLRTWTDASGEHRTEAEFMGYANGQVKLKKPDGTLITLPLDKLSEEDQAWIRKRR